MFLEIVSGKIPLVIGIITSVVLHGVLVVCAVVRLIQFKPKGLNDVLWHLLIQIVPVVGPSICLIAYSKNNTPRFDIGELKRQKEEREKAEALEKEQKSVTEAAENQQGGEVKSK
jgi:hypothetical protein